MIRDWSVFQSLACLNDKLMKSKERGHSSHAIQTQPDSNRVINQLPKNLKRTAITSIIGDEENKTQETSPEPKIDYYGSEMPKKNLAKSTSKILRSISQSVAL